MLRRDVINFIAQEIDAKNYLEIGLQYPAMNYNHINIETKHSVDPGYDIQKFYKNQDDTTNQATHKLESDDFFQKLEAGELPEFSEDHKWDIIFIDGLHLADQVWKDIMNSLNHLAKGGAIVMHDCNPFMFENKWERVIEDQHNSGWNGTTWKAFYKLRTSRSDLSICTVDIDEGVGVIMEGSQTPYPLNNPFFEYRVFEKELNEALNLVSFVEFMNWFSSERNK